MLSLISSLISSSIPSIEGIEESRYHRIVRIDAKKIMRRLLKAFVYFWRRKRNALLSEISASYLGNVGPSNWQEVLRADCLGRCHTMQPRLTATFGK